MVVIPVRFIHSYFHFIFLIHLFFQVYLIFCINLAWSKAY